MRMIRRSGSLSVLAVVLMACAPVPIDGDPAIVTEVVSAEPETPPVLEQCDASDYRPLVGSPFRDAMLVPGDRLRVFSENDIITQEYLPQRTNVVYGSDGLIVRVYCG